ncbi:hypothetical protein J2Z66_001246 [Paenibacillus eucommiae]|uniref:Uncharacterized protein n=1 Tax=Paenibacillus eucommiae TaxID=1355755 RepID=A0ABS4IQ06_9BACL|nr:hypothetical protein [Paenibacillus eucommiae]
MDRTQKPPSIEKWMKGGFVISYDGSGPNNRFERLSLFLYNVNENNSQINLLYTDSPQLGYE